MKAAGLAGGALFFGIDGGKVMSETKSSVAFVKAENRKDGIKSLMKSLKTNPVKGKEVLIKPNFNTADLFPGSTHNDTLMALVE